MNQHAPFTTEQENRIKGIVIEGIDEYFKNKGMTAKQWLITAATVVTAITVIGVSLKTLLGWIGFHQIMKP